MIIYVEVKGSATIVCRVLRGKKIMGAIYGSPMGFYYRPVKGPCAEQYKTIEEVKASLEDGS